MLNSIMVLFLILRKEKSMTSKLSGRYGNRLPMEPIRLLFKTYAIPSYRRKALFKID